MESIESVRGYFRIFPLAFRIYFFGKVCPDTERAHGDACVCLGVIMLLTDFFFTLRNFPAERHGVSVVATALLP